MEPSKISTPETKISTPETKISTPETKRSLPTDKKVMAYSRALRFNDPEPGAEDSLKDRSIDTLIEKTKEKAGYISNQPNSERIRLYLGYLNELVGKMDRGLKGHLEIVHFIGINCGICHPISESYNDNLMKLDYKQMYEGRSVVLNIIKEFKKLDIHDINKVVGEFKDGLNHLESEMFSMNPLGLRILEMMSRVVISYQKIKEGSFDIKSKYFWKIITELVELEIKLLKNEKEFEFHYNNSLLLNSLLMKNNPEAIKFFKAYNQSSDAFFQKGCEISCDNDLCEEKEIEEFREELMRKIMSSIGKPEEDSILANLLTIFR